MRPAAQHIVTLIKYLEGFVLFFKKHRVVFFFFCFLRFMQPTDQLKRL